MSSAMRIERVEQLESLNFEKSGGVVTVVAQDARTRAVLMVAHADREALERTLRSGEMHYRSRTRGTWHKGETSGNVQRVVALYADCDADAVLAIVEAAGPACHTGTTSCFGETPAIAAANTILHRLDAVIAARAAQAPAANSSYTRRLLDDRNLRLKKIGEEAAEFAVACADADRERAVNEAADLVYHMMVALRGLGAGLPDVENVLASRHRDS